MISKFDIRSAFKTRGFGLSALGFYEMDRLEGRADALPSPGARRLALGLAAL